MVTTLHCVYMYFFVVLTKKKENNVISFLIPIIVLYFMLSLIMDFKQHLLLIKSSDLILNKLTTTVVHIFPVGDQKS